MKTTVVLLTMLCCYVSGAQVQKDTEDSVSGNDIEIENLRYLSKASTSSQQTCQPDIHTVLRDMSAMMAEQRVEMRQAKSDLTSMETRLKASESQVEELKRRNQAQEASLIAMNTNTERQLEELRRENEVQAVELASMKAKSNFIMSQVEELRRQNEVRKVAFSASLLASGSGHTGPYNVHTPLVYRNVLTNIGNAYNPNTGFFIAPVRGVYQFKFYIHGSGHSSHGTAAVLVKNGEHVVVAYENQPGHWITSSNGVSLLLEDGDVVYMQLWETHWIYDNGNNYNTFSGHLLFTM